MTKLNIIGLCGSLRQESVNRAALRLAGEVMPEEMILSIAEWRDIPLYDQDEQARGMPDAVTGLVEQLAHADGVIIATPEYNYSIPGAFKNAIDWISRVPDQPFALKPVALISASPSPLGGARMQYDLRKILVFLNAMTLTKPEIFITSAFAKFDEQGKCTDDDTRKFVRGQMVAFSAWIEAVQRLKAAS